MQSNYSTAKGASTPRKRYRNNGYTGHDNPLHRPGGASKAGLDQTFAKEAALRPAPAPGDAGRSTDSPGPPRHQPLGHRHRPPPGPDPSGCTPGDRPLRRRRAQDHHGQRTAGAP